MQATARMKNNGIRKKIMFAKLKETKFIQGWARLIRDMKPMTFTQKVDHLWSYYKEYLIIIIMVVAMICVIITSISYRSQEILVTGMMVNIQIDQEGFDYLSTDYLDHLGGKEGKQRVELDYTTFDLTNVEDAEANYNQSMILIARVSGALLDYAIMDAVAMQFYVTKETFLDLRELFSEEELAALAEENRLIYVREEESTDEVPVAIEITNLAFVQDNIDTTQRIFFSVSGSTPRPERARYTWEYLHAWESKANG